MSSQFRSSFDEESPVPVPKSSKSVFLLLAALLAAATAGAWATDDKASPEPEGDDTVTPAIDPKKLADNVFLRVQDNRNRTQSTNNLKQIALALHNYAAVNGNKLPCDVLDGAGKPLLSWRVLILPYIEQQNLYMKFKLDEPWDSKNNRPLAEIIPKTFISPRVKVKGKGYTVYQIFSGPGALWDKGKTKYTIGTIPDGTSNTIFAVEAGKAVPWSKPADIPFDKDKKVAEFGKPYGGKPMCAIMDGSVRMLDLKKISEKTLKYAIMPDDGMPLGSDW
jgi:hypothetical protein